jgi:hypothetical protein
MVAGFRDKGLLDYDRLTLLNTASDISQGVSIGPFAGRVASHVHFLGNPSFPLLCRSPACSSDVSQGVGISPFAFRCGGYLPCTLV